MKINRVSRSLFKCSNCGFEMNADYNAAINIALRSANKLYSTKDNKWNPICKRDVTGSMSKIKHETCTSLHASINASSMRD